MTPQKAEKKSGLYIVLISVHGLIRGENMELGRDPDTGGQVTYVVELARALARHPEVERVDLLTRRIIDKRIDASYSEAIEPIADKANIVRIPCGPRRYLRKESLWPYLDTFTDHTLQHLRSVGRVPDIVHGHYADAGYVGSQLSRLLGVPFVFTGHSLGRVKRIRLEEKGAKPDEIDRKYQMPDRIEAEEIALDTAILVVASTRQEVEQQYELYDHYEPDRMEVIPPGVDLSRFYPEEEKSGRSNIERAIRRFLSKPTKPIILCMARPDERKNFETLIRAYGENEKLRDLANLVLIAGNREKIKKLEPGAKKVLTNILLLIDEYDLYGHVAYPKKHASTDVPELYRFVTRSGGVFVNPALTEPFGLTLIEAAASGLPIVATNDGGPRDIIETCRNGLLIDPLDQEAIGNALLEVLEYPDQWRAWSKRGIKEAKREYSWDRHVERYLNELDRIKTGTRAGYNLLRTRRSRLPTIDRILVTDIDNTLLGDEEGMRLFLDKIMNAEHVGFAIATGRDPDSARDTLREAGAPNPDFLITCVGTEIYYGDELTQDRAWSRHINYLWKPKEVRRVLDKIEGLYIQDEASQRHHKISYDVDPEEAPSVEDIRRHIRQEGVRANIVMSHEAYLDVLPIRASTGLAIRYLAFKWGLQPEQLLIAGDSGNDEDMLSGNTLGVVVGNYSPELEHLRGKPRIYFAEAEYARGILEGIDFYNFFDEIRIPKEVQETPAS